MENLALHRLTIKCSFLVSFPQHVLQALGFSLSLPRITEPAQMPREASLGSDTFGLWLRPQCGTLPDRDQDCPAALALLQLFITNGSSHHQPLTPILTAASPQLLTSNSQCVLWQAPSYLWLVEINNFFLPSSGPCFSVLSQTRFRSLSEIANLLMVHQMAPKHYIPSIKPSLYLQGRALKLYFWDDDDDDVQSQVQLRK